MKELCVCELCASESDNWVLIDFKMRDVFYTSPNTFAIYECQNCRLLFLNPQPEPEELRDFYPPNEYYAHKARTWDYDKLKVNLCIALSSPIKSFRWAFNRPRIPFVKSNVLKNRNARLLDLGCGDARFLKRLRAHAQLQLYGLDPFLPEGVSIEGVRLFRGELKQALWPSEFFDVVRLSHVLEHLPNPTEVFKELHRILKANGQVIITVPNLKSLACTIFQSNWIGWDVPRHLLHYTPRTLQHFAEAAGFVVHRLSYQGTAFDWTRSLAAKWYHSEFSPRGLRLRRSLLFNLFFTPIACMADMFRLGDCVTAIIRKL